MNFEDLDYFERDRLGDKIIYAHVVDPRWNVMVKRANSEGSVRFYAANFGVEDATIRLHDEVGAVVDRIPIPASEVVDIADPTLLFSRLTVEISK